MGVRLKKSLWIISVSLGWVCPQGFLPMTKILETWLWFRHWYKTPSPIIPEAPVIIIFRLINWVQN